MEEKEEIKKQKEEEKKRKKENKLKEKAAKKELKEKIKKEKMPKEITQEMVGRVFKNVLAAILVLAYFMILNVASTSMREDRLLNDLKVFSATFLIAAIVLFEKGYKNDDGKNAITGIEMLVISGHTLSIMHVITFLKFDFTTYILASAYIFAIYYVLKAIILYTRGKMQYYKNVSSDIAEILKDNEPQKKEATKKSDKEPKIKKEKKIKKIETISQGEQSKEEKEENNENATKTINKKTTAPKNTSKKSTSKKTTKKTTTKKTPTKKTTKKEENNKEKPKTAKKKTKKVDEKND